MKTLSINSEEQNAIEEGIFLVDPQWVHLDEKEVQKAVEKCQKIFKVNFMEDKKCQ